MKFLSPLYSTNHLALAARAPEKHFVAFLFALFVLFLAAMHRYFGFAEPYQMWLREDEIVYLGMWAPSCIEHLTGAFALCSIFTLTWCGFVAPTTRNRALIGLTFAVVYLLTSTLWHDGQQFLASRDINQLFQILSDVVGLALSVLWMAWPESRPAGDEQFA
jgi:hypothetical protein